MDAAGVPTAAFASFTDVEKACAYVQERGAPIVIKADGLAAGKGVTVAETIEQAEVAIHEALEENVFGEAGARVVIEDFLTGEEASILALIMEKKSFCWLHHKIISASTRRMKDPIPEGWEPILLHPL